MVCRGGGVIVAHRGGGGRYGAPGRGDCRAPGRRRLVWRAGEEVIVALGIRREEVSVALGRRR